MRNIMLSLGYAALLGLAICAPAHALDAGAPADPAVKKSDRSSTCHEKGSASYAKTKKFTAYDSMEACIKSGGHAPAAPKTKKVAASSSSAAGK